MEALRQALVDVGMAPYEYSAFVKWPLHRVIDHCVRNGVVVMVCSPGRGPNEVRL